MNISRLLVEHRNCIGVSALSSVFLTHYNILELGLLYLYLYIFADQIVSTETALTYTSYPAVTKETFQEFKSFVLDFTFSISFCLLLRSYSHYYKHSQAELSFDPLTGMRSRYAFNKIRFDKNIQYDNSGDSPYIAVIDVNKFKEINDTYGHDCGDNVLIRVSQVIQENLGEDGRCYRIGGDEFVVLYVAKNDTTATIIFEDLKLKLSHDRILLHLVPRGVTISVGVKKLEKDMRVLDAVNAADQSMYREKNTNRLPN